MEFFVHKVRRELEAKEINLWEEPFYNREKRIPVRSELEKISRMISHEQDLDFLLVLESIRTFQKHSVMKANRESMYTGAPIPEIKLSEEQNLIETPQKFDTTRINWKHEEAGFDYITKSIVHWSAPKDLRLPPPKKVCCDYEKTKCEPVGCFRAQNFRECENCGPNCKNQRIQKGQLMDPECFQVKRDDYKGLCLFTDVDIARNSLVMEYVGEIMGAAEFRRLENSIEPPPKHSYGFEIKPYGITLNARRYGNLSRFISHSCDANLSADIWLVEGISRVVLRAICPIRAGEELTFDYGGDFQAKKKFTCECHFCMCRSLVGGPYTRHMWAYICDYPGCDKIFKNSVSFRNHRSREHKALARIDEAAKKPRGRPRKTQAPGAAKGGTTEGAPIKRPRGRPRLTPASAAIGMPQLVHKTSRPKVGNGGAAAKRGSLDELKVGELNCTFTFERDNGNLWVFNVQHKRDHGGV